MSVFGDLRAEWAAKLTAEYVGPFTVTTDPNANVPFVLFDAITVGAPAGIGAWNGTLPVVVAVPPPGDGPALTALEETLQAVLGVHPAPTSAVPTTWGPRDVPAYVLTYPVQIPNPNC